jgi:hypothetical protein
MWDDNYDRSRGWGVAQVCLNGHVRSWDIRGDQGRGEKFCTECGAETIESCSRCNAPLRGMDWESDVVSFVDKFSAYCHACGLPYPWTASRLEAAAELLKESELSQSEQTQLIAVLPDLAANTTKTQVAVVRYQRLIKNAGKAIQSGMRDILVDVASEAVKKAIWA